MEVAMPASDRHIEHDSQDSQSGNNDQDNGRNFFVLIDLHVVPWFAMLLIWHERASKL
jgi:hypothetical protein